MIDNHTVPRPIATLPTALEKSYRYASSLKTTASPCSSTFAWLVLRKSSHIPLLDFDIICGAMPRLGIQKRLTGETSDREPSVFANYIGPTTLRYFLQMMPKYVLPPGTAVELLNRKRRLSEALSDRASRFLSRVEDLIRHDDPSAVIAAPRGQHIRDIFFEDLTHFSEDLDDSMLLDYLVERATPTEELLAASTQSDKGVFDALRSSYAFLQGKRPRFSGSA
jgi:hypothetical protein